MGIDGKRGTLVADLVSAESPKTSISPSLTAVFRPFGCVCVFELHHNAMSVPSVASMDMSDAEFRSCRYSRILAPGCYGHSY